MAMTRPVVLAAGTAVLVVAGFAFGVRVDNLHNGLLALSFALVGAAVLHRRPGQREARLFLAAGVAQAVIFVGRQAGGDEAAAGRAWAAWLAWLGIWPLPLVLVLVGAAIMCFPDGRFPGPVWRRAWWVTVGMGGVLALVSALWPVDYDRTGVLSAHPVALAGADAARSFFDVAQPLAFPAFQLLWFACVVARYRRAAAAERRQLRWLVGAVGTSVAVLVAGLVLEGSPRAGLLTVWLIPVAAGLAIVEAAYEALVDEVRSAARRIVAAEDEARRRIEQDLHDGAQHRLVVLGMTLGSLVERAERAGEPALVTTAVAARDALLEATAELRSLARGIHPSVLTKDGLAAALDALAERSPLPVRVVADLPGPCAPAVEATAYFVVSEALTNAARHSGASGVDVALVHDLAGLCVEVTDDGCGGAVPDGGLRGLADRVRSLGGSLELDSVPGTGTRVRAELPCA